MPRIRLVAAACAALLSVPFAAAAQDEESTSPFSATAAVTTDYVFRGVSQSNNGVAFQAGATYTAPFGLYASVWGSNVDFAEEGDPDFEIDYNIGWSTDLSDSWNLDLGVNRYTYTGATRDFGRLDYNEYLAKLTWSGPLEIAGTVGYANDYDNSDVRQWYTGLEAGYAFGESGFSLGASVGYTTLKAKGGEWPAREDYYDGAISVSKAFGPATASLGYYDTFGSDASVLRRESDSYKPGVVFTIAVDVP